MIESIHFGSEMSMLSAVCHLIDCGFSDLHLFKTEEGWFISATPEILDALELYE